MSEGLSNVAPEDQDWVQEWMNELLNEDKTTYVELPSYKLRDRVTDHTDGTHRF